MRFPNTSSEHKNLFVVAAIVLIAMGSLLLAFEVGGVNLAVVLHALCIGISVRYFINEPHRVHSLIRERTLVLQDLAYRDGLTGLPNRRFFQWYIEKFMPRQTMGQISGRTITSIVLFDLNGFKAINDTYGHEAGDKLLKHISEKLGVNLPADVLVARLGGDEFVAMVQDGQDGRKLTSVVKAIRKTSKSHMVYQNKRIQVSASVGVSSTYRRRPVLATLMREADKNMYDDKAAQRVQNNTPLRALLSAEIEM